VQLHNIAMYLCDKFHLPLKSFAIERKCKTEEEIKKQKRKRKEANAHCAFGL
jgi:hypothetical protein